MEDLPKEDPAIEKRWKIMEDNVSGLLWGHPVPDEDEGRHGTALLAFKGTEKEAFAYIQRLKQARLDIVAEEQRQENAKLNIKALKRVILNG